MYIIHYNLNLWWMASLNNINFKVHKVTELALHSWLKPITVRLQTQHTTKQTTVLQKETSVLQTWVTYITEYITLLASPTLLTLQKTDEITCSVVKELRVIENVRVLYVRSKDVVAVHETLVLHLTAFHHVQPLRVVPPELLHLNLLRPRLVKLLEIQNVPKKLQQHFKKNSHNHLLSRRPEEKGHSQKKM